MLRTLWLSILVLAGCVQPSELPDGGWEYFPTELVYNTTVGRTDVQLFTIKNNSNRPVEIIIDRPIPDGDCPEEPFIEPPRRLRLGPNTNVEVPVVHAPETASNCVFLIQLRNAAEDATGQRSLRLNGAVVDVDNDEDGWGRGEGDCDDTNPDVNPDAQEACNGIDDDCDDLIDDEDDNEPDKWADLGEEPPDPLIAGQAPYHPDADGDTFPRRTLPQLYCEPPVGWLPPPDPLVPQTNDGWDCNDQVFDIYPDASEAAGEGVDRDCNGYVTCYLDRDADGFGDPFTTVDHPTSDPFCLDGSVGLFGDVSRNFDDCDDGDPAINPNALEVCGEASLLTTGIDENCNGLVDDADPALSDPEVWFLDADGDLFGQTGVTTQACRHNPPAGFVDDPSDCNDGNPFINPSIDEICNGIDDDCDGIPDNDPIDPLPWFFDGDGDGYGLIGADPSDPRQYQLACNQPLGFSPQGTDCDDGNATINPGAAETPGDQIDQDCDGLEKCYIDDDRDGYGTSVLQDTPSIDCAGAYAVRPGDCDDTTAAANPGQGEICDTIDNDCDGRVDDADDSLVADEIFYRDADGDTFGDPGFPRFACTEPPGFVFVDVDAGEPFDCNDTSSSIRPGGSEVVADGIDQDCDGSETCWADIDGDGYGTDGATLEVDDFTCGLPGVSRFRNDCDDTTATISPGAPERCDPADVDEDCDGVADDDDAGVIGRTQWYPDADGDTYGSAAGVVLACDAPALHVSRAGDCNDTTAAINPDAEEVCNTVDDDCDGFVDDQDADLDPADPASLASSWWLDADGDSYGETATQVRACAAPPRHVGSPGDCRDDRPDINPGAVEGVGDGVDQNCDGREACYRDDDGDSWGTADILDVVGLDCIAAGAAIVRGDCDDTRADRRPDAIEICDGVDNDCDILADDADDDVQPGTSDTVRWLRDADADTYGNPGSVQFACSQPTGFVPFLTNPSIPTSPPAATDCDDGNATVNPGATEEPADQVDQNCDTLETCWLDVDDDGFGVPIASSPAADLGCRLANRSLRDDDCDDGDASVNPNGTELCDPFDVDEDCDGLVDDSDGSVVGGTPWFRDGDGDGYGNPEISVTRCEAPPSFVANADDCNDRRSDISPDPSVLEVCDPLNVDENCNGSADDADPGIDYSNPATGAAQWWVDLDGDTYGDETAAPTLACDGAFDEVRNDADCDDNDAAVRPGATELVADGRDQNCDGEELCYTDGDGDGFGATGSFSVSTDLTCSTGPVAPRGGDCDDTNPSVADAQTLYFYDNDGDGYGNPLVFLLSCTPPGAGWITTGGDCDDASDQINPSAREACDPRDVDEDCDGLADDRDPQQDPARFDTTTYSLWYVDADRDGYGDDFTPPESSCDPDFAQVARAGDCDDGDSSVRPGATELIGDGVDQDCSGEERCYVDGDDDGYGTSATVLVLGTDCVAAGEATVRGDCDDADPTRSPGAIEVCDGLDNDCDLAIDDADVDRVVGTSDAETWRRDGDSDGFGNPAAEVYACSQPAGFVSKLDGGGGVALADCNDNDPGVRPGAPEVVADGIDQSCNTFEVCWIDGDTDGFGSRTRSTDTFPLDCVAAGVAPNDDDCDDSDPGVRDDGTVWFLDSDGDTYGDPSVTVTGCAPPPGTWVSRGGDCDDSDVARNPGQAEVCNEIDDDCNGAIDDGLPSSLWFLDADLDTWGDSAILTVACAAPSAGDWAGRGGDCDDGVAAVNPGATEVCNDVDDDCDGTPDDGLQVLWFRDVDGDTFGTDAVTVLDCASPGTGWVSDGGDCADRDAARFPGATEVCNDVDDDCDGSADEGLGQFWYRDFDGDAFGSDTTAIFDCAPPGTGTWVPDGGDCDETRATVNPLGDELLVPCNGLDDDCDGRPDDEGAPDWWFDGDEDGFGAPGTATSACVQPSPSYVLNGDDCDDVRDATYPFAPEICDGFDNDCQPGTFVDQGADCGSDTTVVELDGKTYLFVDDQQDLDDASQFCADRGYHIVWLDGGPGESSLVVAEAGSVFGTSRDFWIGLRDQQECGGPQQWSWFDDRTGACTPADPADPRLDTDFDDGCFFDVSGGDFDQEPGGSTLRFVCELPYTP